MELSVFGELGDRAIYFLPDKLIVKCQNKKTNPYDIKRYLYCYDAHISVVLGRHHWQKVIFIR